MGTAEIFIVFAALMALIALVTIGIDWIGKPLKHRRFIPRIYRYDDEMLPTDEFGHTTLDAPVAATPVGYVPPAPVVVAHVPPGYAPHGFPPGYAPHGLPALPPPMPQRQETPSTPTRAAFSSSLNGADATAESASLPEADASDASHAPAGSAGSAFSSSLSTEFESPAAPERDTDAWRATGLVPTGSGLAPNDDLGTSASRWEPGAPLDISVQGNKPNLATKAERFWKSTAADIDNDSHFDTTEIERMESGKAPRRMNPRTGRLESMQLTGLRQASHPDQVRMQWPEDSVDPWSST